MARQRVKSLEMGQSPCFGIVQTAKFFSRAANTPACPSLLGPRPKVGCSMKVPKIVPEVASEKTQTIQLGA